MKNDKIKLYLSHVTVTALKHIWADILEWSVS